MNQGIGVEQMEEKTYKLVVLLDNVVCRGGIRNAVKSLIYQTPNTSIRDFLSVFYKRITDGLNA